MGQGAFTEPCDLTVELRTDPRDLRFGDPGVDAEGWTRSSALRVETPWTLASMITACNALSIRLRRSSSAGKNDPDRSFGICTSTSPEVVETVLGRCPLRWVLLPSARWQRPAPIFSVASASINACRPARINSANTDAESALVSASSWASKAEWSWVIAWIAFSESL